MELGAFTVVPVLRSRRASGCTSCSRRCRGARLTHSYCASAASPTICPTASATKLRDILASIDAVLVATSSKLLDQQPDLPRPHGRHRRSSPRTTRSRTASPARVCALDGVAYDVRKDHPYLVYDRFDFDVPVGTKGDNFDRYLVRIEEMQQSMRILEQALAQIPAGPGDGRRPARRAAGQARGLQLDRGDDRATSSIIMDGIRVPPGEAYSFTEGGNGELGFYIVVRRHRPPVQVPRAAALLRATCGRCRRCMPRPLHRRHRADLRHDQHDRRGVRSLSD